MQMRWLWNLWARIIDPAQSLASLLWQIFFAITGLSVASMIAWATTTWEWYWQTLNLAGIAFSFLVAWFVLASGFYLIARGVFHYRRVGDAIKTANKRAIQTEGAQSQPAVQFWLPGNWETPIRHGSFADSSGETFPAEEIVLRIAARQNLQNVRARIKVLKQQGVGDSGDRVMAEFSLPPNEFGGSVTKGMRVEIVVARRGFRIFEMEHKNHLVRARAELGTIVLPETGAKIKLNRPFRPFIVKAEVFHDNGPDVASFKVESLEDRPLTHVTSRHNVEPIGE